MGSVRTISTLLHAMMGFEFLLNLWMNAQIKHSNIKRDQWRIKGTQNPGIYNERCKTLRRQFEQLAKHVQKFPKNPHTLGQYNKIKRKYKHTLKTILQKWEIENRVLENLSSNPKLFWQHIKKLRGKTNNSPNQVNSIPPKKWVEHFSSLFNVKENDKNKLECSNKIPSDKKHDAVLDSVYYRGNFKRN